MSDQMPDEVWLERPRWDGWGEYTTKRVENPRVHRVRYIRTDLYDSKSCPHVVGEVTQHCALAQDEVEALRAALMRIADYERNWREAGEVALEDVQSMAREALGDD